MSWTGESIAALLRAVLEHRPGRFELEHDGLRIVVEPDAEASRPVAQGSVATSADGPTERPAPRGVSPAAGAPAAAPTALAPGEVAVGAPTVGVFYRRPEPSAPPFVEVGDEVAAGATVGLVEVMKVFSAVTAPAAGRVVRVLADDAGPVSLGQPLIVLAVGGA